MAANDGPASSSSARLACIDYPAEVDDLIAERDPNDVLSFAAAAGYAIVASPLLERAFLFSIPAGSAADAIPIALPPRQRFTSSSATSNNYYYNNSNGNVSTQNDMPSISLAMWLSERSASSTAKSLGIAILSSDAVLRIYPYVPVDDDPLPMFSTTASGAAAAAASNTHSVITPRSGHASNYACLEIQVDQALYDSIAHSADVGSGSEGDAALCRALHVTAFERGGYSNTDGDDGGGGSRRRRDATGNSDDIDEDTRHNHANGDYDYGIVGKCKTELIVYGSRGSAAHVVFSDSDSAVFPLPRDNDHHHHHSHSSTAHTDASSPPPADRGSLRFGSLFYSAIRSIGAGLGAGGSGRNTDWQLGTGPYEIVKSHPLADGVIVVRRGGDVERWNTSRLLWTFNALTSKPVTPVGGPSLSSASSMFSSHHYHSRGSSALAAGSIVSSAATSENTLVLLTQSSSPMPHNHHQSSSAATSPPSQHMAAQHHVNCQLQCYDVRSAEIPPDTCHMSIAIDNSSTAAHMPMAASPFGIVACSDVVFLVNPDQGRLAWRSVARGVPADGQVIGSLDANPISDMLFLADVSRGLHFSSTSGVAACLHHNGIMLSCFEVPAPVSEDMLAVGSSEAVTISTSLSLLWRSFLQYSAGQRGAARASLLALVNMIVAKGFDTSEALSQLVTLLSREIVTKDKGAFQLDSSTIVDSSNGQYRHLQRQPDRKPFLIDSGLVCNGQAHHTLLNMLTDTELFTQVRPDAPSLAEDQIWDALDLGARYAVITDNEMLAAAHAVRQVENAESVRDQTGGFNEAAATNILSSSTTVVNENSTLKGGKVIEIARALRATLICENEELRESLNTVNMALERVGQQLRDVQQQQQQQEQHQHQQTASAQGRATDIISPPVFSTADLATEPYRLCYDFYLFLPALDVILTQTLQRLSYDHNVPVDDENIDNNSVYLAGARSAVSLSCEAVIAFLESAMEAREVGSAVVSRGLVGLNGLRSWLLETTEFISALQSIAKQSMVIGLKSTGRERESIMGLATLVVDKLLASARQGGGAEAAAAATEREYDRQQKPLARSSSRSRSARSAAKKGSSTRHQQKHLKRRRLEVRDVNSEWRRLLKSCMRLLRDHDLDDEAFRLAEKHGDYDTMMALQVNSDHFNAFMEKSIGIFGVEFARFAFQWLEERGHIELLLRGRSEVGDDSVGKQSYCEREPIKTMLSDYFCDNDSTGVADGGGDNAMSLTAASSLASRGQNLSWMHWLAIGDVNRGAQALEVQMNGCAKPHKPASRGNTMFLSSITKLASYCAVQLEQQQYTNNNPVDNITNNTDTAHIQENSKRLEVASARIGLLAYQKVAFDDADGNGNGNGDLRSGTEIIRGLVDACEADSATLAMRVSTALDAARLCQVVNDDGWGLRDYVWRRCVERQSCDWVAFAQDAYAWTDVELRSNLGRTALYKAARDNKLNEHHVEEMLARGILDGGDVEKSGVIEQVSELMRTTVALANIDMVY